MRVGVCEGINHSWACLLASGVTAGELSVTVGDWPRVLRRTASNWAFCVVFWDVRSPWVRPRRLSPRLELVVTGILCWPSLPSGVGGGALWRGGEESGVYASGVLDCVSAGGQVAPLPTEYGWYVAF
jgi:hypothetical protein